MEYARDSIEKLAEKLNLSNEVTEIAQDIINEFLRKNKEWTGEQI